MQNKLITGIVPGSIAEELGIEPQDFLTAINGVEIKDVFDYRFQVADDNITLMIQKKDGQNWEFEIEKEASEDLGLEFGDAMMDEEKSCRNKCVFCFIDQLPKGMRETLYFKDDDARLSFLFGNYITLTNLDAGEIDRIIGYRMSPVNVSVHTTNPDLRVKMLNNRFAGDVLKKLKKFTENDITVNCQIVVCPGFNDRKELDRTLTDLTSLGRNIHSISVVPVGLTQHREGLAGLQPFDKASAHETIKQVEQWQKALMDKFSSRVVYAADELYIMAGLDLPPYEAYEDFPQIENGVGMVSSFVQEALEALNDIKPKLMAKSFSIATGVSFYPVMKGLCAKIEASFNGLKIYVYPVVNHFFGTRITVTGLLTGQDVISQLSGKELGEGLLLSSTMFRAGTDCLLDDVSLKDISEKLGVDAHKVDNDGYAFVEMLVQDA